MQLSLHMTIRTPTANVLTLIPPMLNRMLNLHPSHPAHHIATGQGVSPCIPASIKSVAKSPLAGQNHHRVTTSLGNPQVPASLTTELNPAHIEADCGKPTKHPTGPVQLALLSTPCHSRIHCNMDPSHQPWSNCPETVAPTPSSLCPH